MTYWVPSPKRWLAAALVLLGIGAAAQPAAAVPIVDVGADVGAAFHWSGGPALDLTGDVDLRGVVLSAQYWTQFGAGPVMAGGTNNYEQATVRYNVSPVPMLNISPGIGVSAINWGFGPLANVYGSFSPVLLPVSIEAQAGAAYLQNSLMYPYFAGIKFSLIPFTAFNLRYRGWGGTPGTLLGSGGPEFGVQIGI